MPLYEYQCLECRNRFELRRSYSDASAVTCPECHGDVRRVMSPVAVIFRGSGFYATDNGRRSAEPKEQEQHQGSKGLPAPGGAAKP